MSPFLDLRVPSPSAGPLLLLAAWVGCSGPPPAAPHDDTEPIPDPRSWTETAPTETGAAPEPAEPESLCQVSLECSGGILDEPRTPCALQILDGEGAEIYSGEAGVELRGRSSLYFPKKQYAIELRTHSELPVWPDSRWAYLDDGSDPGDGWRDPGFDDSAWSTGPAPLGFGGDWLQTVIDGRPLTTYFRDTFTVSSRTEITRVDLGLVAHDGAVVWLNGKEVQRVNLPSVAKFDTPASGDPPADDHGWEVSEIDPALLVDGPNTLAVEVHRAGPESTDLRFNLWLEASGDDRSIDLLGMGGEEDWILNGQYVDRVLFRNRLAFDLFQSLGGPERSATESRFCELRLDGEYRGIYTLGERLDQDDDRIAISPGEPPGESFVVKLGDSEGFHHNAVGYGTWELVFPDPDPTAQQAVSEWLTGWEQAITGPDPSDPETGIFAWLDLESAVDWVLVNELLKNHDAYQLSVWLWKDQYSKARFAPWDLDLSMGYPYTDCGAEGFVSRRVHASDGSTIELAFIQAMAAVPSFREALVARWRELRSGPWTEEAILERIAGYDRTLAPALPANSERWPVDQIVFRTDDPEVESWLCPVDSYQEEHDRTLTFLRERLVWLDANIASF